MDTDGSGYISVRELKTLFEKNHLDLQLDEVEQIFDKMDVNHDGKVSFSEFVAAVSNKKDFVSGFQLDQAF